MAGEALLILAVAASLGGGLLLVWLIRAEGADRRVMSRPEAERAARRDSVDEE